MHGTCSAVVTVDLLVFLVDVLAANGSYPCTLRLRQGAAPYVVCSRGKVLFGVNAEHAQLTLYGMYTI